MMRRARRREGEGRREEVRDRARVRGSRPRGREGDRARPSGTVREGVRVAAAWEDERDRENEGSGNRVRER